jgi:hypothetical protein
VNKPPLRITARRAAMTLTIGLVVAMTTGCGKPTNNGPSFQAIPDTTSPAVVKSQIREALNTASHFGKVHMVADYRTGGQTDTKLDFAINRDPLEAIGTIDNGDGMPPANIRHKNGKQILELGPDNITTNRSYATWDNLTWFKPMYSGTNGSTFSTTDGAGVVDGNLSWILDSKTSSASLIKQYKKIPARFTISLSPDGKTISKVVTQSASGSLRDVGFPYDEVVKVYSDYKK